MTTISHVTDIRSNLNDQIVYAARIIGRSGDRRKVFEVIYFGKKKCKTVSEIAKAANLRAKRVLEEGRKLASSKVVGQTKVGSETAYVKDDAYSHLKNKILSLNANRKKLQALPTKTSPKISGGKVEIVTLPKALVKAELITVDGVDSFRNVRNVQASSVKPQPMAEARFKHGVKTVVGEAGKFRDWGGEGNDLYTTRVKIGGKRVAAAFAFKGKGKKGKLTPKQMGKNGDQILRLFRSPADVFIVQYWNQIDESVIEQMKHFAVAKSVMDEKKIYYGIMDGTDSARLIAAYPEAFRR